MEKLSQIFKQAQKEFIQIKGTMGHVSTKTACAFGVILYYWGKPDGHSDYLSVYRLDEKHQLIVDSFSRFLRTETEYGIVLNNDRPTNLTFADFEKLALKFERIFPRWMIKSKRNSYNGLVTTI